jgi:hypothetical protein
VFTALLDTSVLWPSLQRDFLLSLSVEGLYRPVWSLAILDELAFHEAEKLVRRGTSRAEAVDRAARLVRTMQAAFGDATVVGWEPLEHSFGLPDPDDEHVVAAAVIARAGAIVTSNLRHFPGESLPDDLAVLSPREFALNTVADDRVGAQRAVRAIAGRSGRVGASWTTDEVLDCLEERYGMAEAVALLREPAANAEVA